VRAAQSLTDAIYRSRTTAEARSAADGRRAAAGRPSQRPTRPSRSRAGPSRSRARSRRRRARTSGPAQPRTAGPRPGSQIVTL